MLRHFKMELKRQQELESENQVCQLQAAGPMARPLVVVADAQGALNMKKQRNDTTKSHMQQQQPGQQPKRVRGRRSSKPQMEKRRRARINECLDILKSYVLTDAANLNKLGIDLTASENQDEDTIARSLLKSSGLINRHRGRKNPNKLEKADILELTVDYVRRLHEHRDELLASSAASMDVAQSLGLNFNQQQQQDLMYPAHCQDLRQQVVPAHLNQPLTLDLSPKSRSLDGRTTTTSPAALMAYRQPPNTLLTPPSSSGSLSRQNRADVEMQKQHQYQDQVSQMVLSRALSSYKHPEWTTN